MLRKLLGLCEHRWTINHGVIRHFLHRTVDGKEFTTGYSQVRECEKCGKIKSFQL